MGFGRANVFYTELTPQRCTAAMLFEIDSTRLGRKRGLRLNELGAAVRCFGAPSLLALALSRTFGPALASGRGERAELRDDPLDFEVRVSSLSPRCERWACALFEPLGYELAAESVELGSRPVERRSVERRSVDILGGESPSGESPSPMRLVLRGKRRLSEALAHLCVLLPVLDHETLSLLDPSESDSLIRCGAGWLESHPEHEWIARCYSLSRTARDPVARLEPSCDPSVEMWMDEEERRLERRLVESGTIQLADERREFLINLVRASGARTVAEWRAGDGALLCELARARTITRVVGAEHSDRALARLASAVDGLPEGPRNKVELIKSSPLYRDERLADLDAAILSEVIEHLEPGRLTTFADVLLGASRPGLVVITTPNHEYSVKLEGAYRHRDHRFEWTRAELRGWATQHASSYGYSVRFAEIGESDCQLGAPTQVAIFERTDWASRRRGRTQ